MHIGKLIKNYSNGFSDVSAEIHEEQVGIFFNMHFLNSYLGFTLQQWHLRSGVAQTHLDVTTDSYQKRICQSADLVGDFLHKKLPVGTVDSESIFVRNFKRIQ